MVWGDENSLDWLGLGCFLDGEVGVNGRGDDGLFICCCWDGGDIVGVVVGDVVFEFLWLLWVLCVLVVEVLDVIWIENYDIKIEGLNFFSLFFFDGILFLY